MNRIHCALFFVFSLLTALFPSHRVAAAPLAQWISLDVNVKNLQGDAHLIRIPGVGDYLIDTGYPKRVLLTKLRKYNVRFLKAVIITHAHEDHFGALRELFAENFPIEKIYFTLPSFTACESEPWGCRARALRSVRIGAHRRGLVFDHLKEDSLLAQGKNAELRCLYHYTEQHSPLPRINMNDTSPLLRLTAGANSVLFTGDLNQGIGEYLVEQRADVRATLFKVPHHGTESTTSNAFFDRVNAKFAVVPAPSSLWNSPRSERIRSYFEAKKIPVWVNGDFGDIQVDFYPETFSVKTER